MEPSIGENSLTCLDFLNRVTKAAWLPSLALADVGFGLPSLLGGQVGQELQLCLEILEDPVSTKKWAGMKGGLLPPSFWVGSIYLPDPLWLPMRPCSSGLAPEIYHGHLDYFSHLLPPRPRSQVHLHPAGPAPSNGTTLQGTSVSLLTGGPGKPGWP